MSSFSPFVWWANFAALALASAIDIRTRRIPNWLAVPFLACGLAFQTATGGWRGAAAALAGAAVAGAWLIVPCWRGAMGMGDLKLAAGAGAWLGPQQAFLAMVLAALAGGVIALGFAMWRGQLGSSLNRTAGLIPGLGNSTPRPAHDAGGLSIPYAPAIAFGAMFSFLTR
jgi:prepilin peptidase CpaA